MHEDWVLDCTVFPPLSILGWFACLAECDRGIEYPAKEHQHKVDEDSCCRDEEGSKADEVVVVDPTVATTTTVELPIDAAGIEYHPKDDGSRNGTQSSP